MPFPECPTYANDQIWTCQPPEIQPGQARGNGCDIGCHVCPDSPAPLRRNAVHVHGKRWLLPNENGQGRDAHGRLHDLQASRPRKVPLVWDGLRSPCWKNDGTECHGGTDVCSCHPGESRFTDKDTHTCENGEFAGTLLTGTFPDCTSYSGFRIFANASGDWMKCRTVGEHGNIRTRLRAGRLGQSAFFRFGDQDSSVITEQRGGCTAIMMAECVGEVPQSNCLTGHFWSPLPGFPHPEFYNDHPCRQAWNFCTWQGSSIRILDNPIFPTRNSALIAAKNAVLAVVVDPVAVWPDGNDLRQLDYQAPILGNGFLDYWTRGVDTPDTMPCDDPAMVVAGTFPGAYLKNARCAVSAELVVVRVFLEMSLVPYKVDETARPEDFPDPEDRRVYPHTRFRITAECGVRAWFPDGTCTLTRPWIPEGEPGHSVPLRIINPGPGQCVGVPVVVANSTEEPVDEIIYANAQGQVFTPPTHVQWEGFLGEFSDPKVADVWQDSTACLDDHTLNQDCLRLADALTGLEIPGWPAFTDSHPDDPNQIYGGKIRLNFKNDIYQNCCKGGTP